MKPFFDNRAFVLTKPRDFADGLYLIKLDYCALITTTCETWSAELYLMSQPPVVAKSCSNPRVHNVKVYYQRGTLVE